MASKVHPLPISQIFSNLPNLPNLIVRSLAAVRPLLSQHARRAPRLLILNTNVINPNLRLRKRIRRIPVRRHKIDTNSVRKRRDEKAQRHHHAELRAVPRIRRSAQDRRDDGTTADGAHDPAGASLGVFAQAAHAQGHDGGENDGLEEERDEQQGDAGVASVCDRGRDEDDAAGEIEDEDPSGTDKSHQEGADEAAEGETALGSCEQLRGAGVGVLVVGVSDVVDEL
jgi:hypothetical protein